LERCFISAGHRLAFRGIRVGPQLPRVHLARVQGERPLRLDGQLATGERFLPLDNGRLSGSLGRNAPPISLFHLH